MDFLKIKKKLILTWCEDQLDYFNVLAISDEIVYINKIIDNAYIKYGDEFVRFIQDTNGDSYVYRLVGEAMRHGFDFDTLKVLYEIYPVVEIFDDDEFKKPGSATIKAFAEKSLNYSISENLDADYILKLQQIVHGRAPKDDVINILNKSINITKSDVNDKFYLIITNGNVVDEIIDNADFKTASSFEKATHIIYTQDLMSDKSKYQSEIKRASETFDIKPSFDKNHKYWCESYTSNKLDKYVEEYIDFFEDSIALWINDSEDLYYKSNDGMKYKTIDEIPNGYNHEITISR